MSQLIPPFLSYPSTSQNHLLYSDPQEPTEIYPFKQQQVEICTYDIGHGRRRRVSRLL